MVHPKNNIKFEIIFSKNISVTLWITQMDHIPILNNKWAGKVCAFFIWKSKSHAQSCLCNPMDCIACQAPLPIGILQARILKWVAISSSRGSSQPRYQTHISCIAGRLFTVEPPEKSQSMSVKDIIPTFCTHPLWVQKCFPLFGYPQILVSLDHSSSTFMFSLT